MTDYLKTLKIKGIQSHMDTEIEFYPGLNVIYGGTDKGKSVILRSINFVVQNYIPPKTIFINWNLKKTQPGIVEMHFSNGAWVSREKSENGKINQYRFSTHDEPLVAIGKTVPKEVFDILRMGQENIQLQETPYFLLDQTPGKVAKEFNKLADLEVAEVVLSNIRSDLMKWNSEISIIDSDIEHKQEELNKFKKLGMLKKEFATIEKVNIKIDIMKEKQTAINKSFILINSVTRQIKSKQSIKIALKEFYIVLKELNTIIDMNAVIKKMTWLSQGLGLALGIVNKYKDTENSIKAFKTLLKSMSKLEEKQKSMLELQDMESKIMIHSDFVFYAEKDIEKLKEKEKELKKKLKICFVCGGKL